jgi:hypothetical protein
LISKKSSLKPLCQMNRNLERSILGRSSLKIAHLVPIRYQTCPPQTILVSDWLISKNSSPETRIAFGGHVCQRTETKLAVFIKDFPGMLPTEFRL